MGLLGDGRGSDQVQARSAEGVALGPAQNSAATIALDQEALKSALLALSPAEKLRIAGDRIGLAKSLAKSNVLSTAKGARVASMGVYACTYCGERIRAPQRAR